MKQGKENQQGACPELRVPTPLTLVAETSDQGGREKDDGIPHTDRVLWAFLREMALHTHSKGSMTFSLNTEARKLQKVAALMGPSPPRRTSLRVCKGRKETGLDKLGREALRLEPRKRKADPKRKEVDADLKGVKVMHMGLSERSSSRSPCPCGGGCRKQK